MQNFQADVYDGGAKLLRSEFRPFRSDSAARSWAARLAKASGGPVDLARAGNADWNERYMTTAAPCEFSASGCRFERLDG